jgi:hypothetical protein
MSAWIPLLTGLLAFIGVLLGHYVHFVFGATAKRREVRRLQIERFAELISEDLTWMDTYRRNLLFGEGKIDGGTEPNDKAFAIYALYFWSDLTEAMLEFTAARDAYKDAIANGYAARLQLAMDNHQPLSVTRLAQAQLEPITERYRPYYQALLNALEAASNVAEQTIPESRIARWMEHGWKQMADRWHRLRSERSSSR